MKKYIVSLLAFLLNACVSTKSAEIGPEKESNSDEESIAAIRLSSLQTLADLIPSIATHKAVLIGETHTSYGDHYNQLAVIKQLKPQWSEMAIGIEYVQKPFQKYLDQFIAGEIDEAQMLLKTEWYERWRYDYRLYRPIFNYAQKHKIKLIALNIPREVTKEIMQVGIADLQETSRAHLPTKIFKKNKKYRQWLEKIYSHHGGDVKSSGFEHFYEAQLAWDEGMANTSAQYLEENPEAHLVVIVGQGHIQNRYGIPSRLERRINSKVAVVLNGGNEKPVKEQGDFYLFSPEKELSKTGKIDAELKNVDSTLVITKVAENGVADKSGLQNGDIIIAIDKQAMHSVADYKIYMLDKKPKDKISIEIKTSSGAVKVLELELGD